MFLNAYALPPIFVLLTLMGLLQLKKKQKGWLKFKQSFRYCYLNQLIGGTASMIFILLYMNVVSTETRDIFNYQLWDTWYTHAQEELMGEDAVALPNVSQEDSNTSAKGILSEIKNRRDNLSENVFSLSNSTFWGFFLSMNMFYILNSVFLSLFFKTPKQIQ